MPGVYLWTNAALYALFGVLCLARLRGTAHALGYIDLNPAGKCEYAVVYGGLQLGLAAFFAWAASRDASVAHAALVLAAALYVPIVLIRWSGVVRFALRAPLTLAVAALETALAAGALALLWSSH